MDGLERAVAIAIAPAPNIDREEFQKAQAICDAFAAKPDAWNDALHIFVATGSATLELRFWALQVLTNQLPNLPARPHREKIREVIIGQYLTQSLPNAVVNTGGTGEPPFIRNRLVGLYTSLVVLDVPESWKDPYSRLITFVADLWQTLGAAEDQKEERLLTLSQRMNLDVQRLTPDTLRRLFFVICDFLLKILIGFDQDVVDETASRLIAIDPSRRAVVKDGLKVHEVPCAIELFLFLFRTSISVCSDGGISAMNWDKLREPLGWSLISQALDAAARFIAWIDISFVANVEFLSHIFGFLGLLSFRCPVSNDIPFSSLQLAHGLKWSPAAVAASQCLQAFARKGAAPLTKIHLLRNFAIVDNVKRLMEFLPQEFSADDDEDVIDFSESLAELIGAIGEELCSILEELKDCEEMDIKYAAWEQLTTILPSALQLMSHPVIRISESCEPFIGEFLRLVRAVCSLHTRERLEQMGISEEMKNQILSSILTIAAGRTKYPPDLPFASDAGASASVFDPHRPHPSIAEETDAVPDALSAFLQYRNDMTNLVKKVTACDKSLACNFLARLIDSIVTSSDAGTLEARDAEAALHLLFSFCDHLKDASNRSGDKSHPLHLCIARLCYCRPLFQSSHPEVKMLLFDVFVRYHHVFKSDLELLEHLVELLTGPLGIFTTPPDTRVASHAVLCLVVVAKGNIGRMSRDLYEKLVNSLLNILTSILMESFSNLSDSPDTLHLPKWPTFSGALCREDVYRLLEVTGSLISSTTRKDIPADLRSQYFSKITRILLPPLCRVIPSVGREAHCSVGSLHTKAKSQPLKLKSWADLAAHLISCLGALARGTADATAAAPLLDQWIHAMRIAAVCFQFMWDRYSIRCAFLLVCRRMVALLPFEHSKAPLGSALAAMAWGGGDTANPILEMQKVNSLVSFIAVTFKQKSRPLFLGPPMSLRETEKATLMSGIQQLASDDAAVTELVSLSLDSIKPVESFEWRSCMEFILMRQSRYWNNEGFDDGGESGRESQEAVLSSTQLVHSIAVNDIQAILLLLKFPVQGSAVRCVERLERQELATALQHFIARHCEPQTGQESFFALHIFRIIINFYCQTLPSVDDEDFDMRDSQELGSWIQNIGSKIPRKLLSLDLKDAQQSKCLGELAEIIMAACRSPSCHPISRQIQSDLQSHIFSAFKAELLAAHQDPHVACGLIFKGAASGLQEAKDALKTAWTNCLYNSNS